MPSSQDPRQRLGDLLSHRLLPVVVLDDPDLADPLADALVAGGLPVAEVTLRSAGAMDVLGRMARRSDLAVGAGTVVNREQAARCIDLGAGFLVSPGTSDDVVTAGAAAGIPVVPGVATPTEVMRALDLGVSTVKLFPASSLGGLATLRALAAPFPEVRFVPTGGIDAEAAGAYLADPAVAAVGGSWMVPSRLIGARDFAEITRLTAEAVELASA